MVPEHLEHVRSTDRCGHHHEHVMNMITGHQHTVWWISPMPTLVGPNLLYAGHVHLYTGGNTLPSSAMQYRLRVCDY